MTDVIANLAAEHAVLGGVLLDNDAFDRVGALEAAHFYRADHQAIYSQIQRMLGAGQSVDVLTLHDRLQQTAPDLANLQYLHALVQETPSAANVARYAEIVRERAQRRALAALSTEIADTARQVHRTDTGALIEQAQAGLERIAQERINRDPIRAADDLPAYIEELQRREAGEGAQVIPTGYPDLDKRLMGGARRGDLVIIAGRPKMGKTAFALNVGLNASGAEFSVAVFSMEMPRTQLHDRHVAVLGKIPLAHLLNPQDMTDDEWPCVTHAVQRLEAMRLFLDDQGALRLMDIRLKCRALKRRHGLDLIIIDYLQLMEGEGDTRNSQIEQITRGLKALAKELDIAILLLSQLNRTLEQRPNKRPTPADLRDSGAIEQDCDIALFLYRDEVYNPDSPDAGICEVNVGLIRQGQPGTVALAYVAPQTRFESIAQGVAFGQGRPTKQRVKYSGLQD